MERIDRPSSAPAAAVTPAVVAAPNAPKRTFPSERFMAFDMSRARSDSEDAGTARQEDRGREQDHREHEQSGDGLLPRIAERPRCDDALQLAERDRAPRERHRTDDQTKERGDRGSELDRVALEGA